MSDLSELSKSYYSEADVYKIFSDAEDRPGYIYDYLKNLVSEKSVLDVGCGNGKYCQLLTPYCDIVGVDKASGQLLQANRNLKLVQADCLSLPFIRSFDYAIACWMLGTLIYPEKQKLALKEIQKTLKDNGQIVLIENAPNSEFEIIRGRNKDTRTEDYNQFLLNNGFYIAKTIDTYFEFDNIDSAKRCFKSIWGDKIETRITSRRIEHQVLILLSKPF